MSFKKGFIISAVLVVLILTGAIVSMLQQYTDHTVLETVDIGDAGASKNEDFEENVLRYTNDGAFFTDDSGNLIWNVTYEMDAPAFSRAGDYFVIYDKGGTAVVLMDRAGKVSSLQTLMPVVKATVSENGILAVLLQQDTTGYVKLYDKRGQDVASGEFHAKNNGFPIEIGISRDGKLLAVSLLQIIDGAVNTNINFYDFGERGKSAIDNLVASFSYSNMVVPDIHFFAKDRMIAFGDTEFMIYDITGKPVVDEEMFLQGEVKAVFYNDNNFGTVTGETDEEGNYKNMMTIYSKTGRRRFEREINIPYKEVKLLSNNEIFATDGNEALLFSAFGVRRFDQKFDGTIYEMFPRKGGRRYVVVKSSGMESIRLEKQ